MISSSSKPLAGLMLTDEEQRREGRVQTVYRPCCIRTERECTVGLIRNISPGGVMVETALAAEPGSEVSWFEETAQWRRARVVWREGACMGLETVDGPDEEAPAFPSRAIRIPTSLLGRVWLRGQAVEVGIGNISHKGVLVFGMPPVEPATLFTVSVAGREFAQTSLRWWADGSAGLQFARPMTLRELAELIEQAGRGGAGLYHERRIAGLLEVVPANDPNG